MKRRQKKMHPSRTCEIDPVEFTWSTSGDRCAWLWTTSTSTINHQWADSLSFSLSCWRAKYSSEKWFSTTPSACEYVITARGQSITRLVLLIFMTCLGSGHELHTIFWLLLLFMAPVQRRKIEKDRQPAGHGCPNVCILSNSDMWFL